MNLYNKIYNAINEGIQKALLIDPEQNDVSINYSYHKIDNSIDPLLMEFVDLGLPSGTLWCNHNLGATCGTDASSWYGDYYAWGELETKPVYTEDNYKWIIKVNQDAYIFKKYDNKQDVGDNLKILLPADDVVTQKYSEIYNSKIAKGCMMPTKDECQELLDYTTCNWEKNYQGVYGLCGNVLTSIINQNQIFIPAAGTYALKVNEAGLKYAIWSKTVVDAYSFDAYYLYGNDNLNKVFELSRHIGFSARAVYKIN